MIKLNELKDLETNLLFAELDDIIQLELMKLSHDEWASLKKDRYHAIINELKKRVK